MLFGSKLNNFVFGNADSPCRKTAAGPEFFRPAAHNQNRFLENVVRIGEVMNRRQDETIYTPLILYQLQYELFTHSVFC
jgi:hypothetical protein